MHLTTHFWETADSAPYLSESPIRPLQLLRFPSHALVAKTVLLQFEDTKCAVCGHGSNFRRRGYSSTIKLFSGQKQGAETGAGNGRERGSHSEVYPTSSTNGTYVLHNSFCSLMNH